MNILFMDLHFFYLSKKLAREMATGLVKGVIRQPLETVLYVHVAASNNQNIHHRRDERRDLSVRVGPHQEQTSLGLFLPLPY